MAKTRNTASDDPEESQVRMTFGEHLEELRKRIIFSFLGSIFGIVLCLIYIREIVQILTHPYRIALLAHHQLPIFNYATPAEPVITFLGLAFKCGLILSSPWIIYQLWCFVAAGLYPRERRIVYRYVAPTSVLFLLGVAFLYFVVLPMTLNFVVGFTEGTAGPPPTPTPIEKIIIGEGGSIAIDPAKFPKGDDPDLLKILPHVPIVSTDPPAPEDGKSAYLFFNATEGKFKLRAANVTLDLLVAADSSLFTNQPRLDDYLGFVMFAALVFGLAFELPMVIMILAQIGLVETQTWRNIRKYAYLVLAVVSAIAAPSSDVLTMLCLMLPLMALYEAGILAAAMVTRPKPE